jgi:hypothetical protein
MNINLSEEEFAYQVYSKVATDFVGDLFFYGSLFSVLYFFVFKILHWVLLVKISAIILAITAFFDLIQVLIVIISTIGLFFIKEEKQHYFHLAAAVIRTIGCALFIAMSAFLIYKVF